MTATTGNQRAAKLSRLTTECEAAAIRLEAVQRHGHRQRIITGSAAEVIAALLGYTGKRDFWRICIQPAAGTTATKRKKTSRSSRPGASVDTTGERDGGTVVILDPSCVGETP